MNRKITYKEAIGEALNEEFERNRSLLSFGGDIFDNGGELLHKFLYEKFPQRIIRTPLVEEMFGAIGLGLAIGGFKPVITLDHGTFITFLLDDLYRLGIWRYRTAQESGPEMIVRLSGGRSGKGPEFSAVFLALPFHLPNIAIAVPATPYHAKGLLKEALRQNRPVLYFEHKSLYEVSGEVPVEDYIVPFGTSSIWKNGKDITIIAWSYLAHIALEVGSTLTKEGVDAEVLVLHTLYPLDMSAIFDSAARTSHIVVVEEDQLRGGIGAEIGMRILEEFPQCLVRRVAPRVPLASGPYEKLTFPSKEDILRECLNCLGKSAV